MSKISAYIFGRSISLQDSAKYERQVWIDTLTILTTKHQEELEKAVEALEWVLPMAKGYAHEHNVGRNKAIVQHAEEVLQALTPTTPDKQ